MRSPDVAFRLESTAAGTEQLAAVGEAFPSAPDAVAPLERTYFDTFDWRLLADGGGVIVRHGRGGGRVEWRRGRGRPLALPGTAPPDFAAELPAGAVRDALASVIDVRRLLPLVRVAGKRHGLRILNEDRKTVTRVWLEERRAAAGRGGRWRPLDPLLRLVPVRGYEKAMREVESFLAERLGPAGPPPPELGAALGAIEATPGGYSSKLAIRLSPEATGGEAAREIHRTLFEMMLANEPGLRQDLDIEFLHDFRVAVRRTRTALSQIRDVFPARELEHFKREFSWLGGLTGLSRDLDVFLQRMEGYRASLPASARGDLDPLETLVRRRRAAQRRRVEKGLVSARYRRLKADWRRFLKTTPAGASETPSDALRPVREVADRNIRRAYRRVLKRGRAIGDESPPEALHRLRIDCKKLRYLLEFFRSLYRQKEITGVIAELKRLQENLGDFNDYAVQQEMLESFAAALGKKSPAPVATLMDIGRLVAHLEEGETAERLRFARKFARFSRKKSRRLFERLLASEPPAREEG